jgi:ABC-type sugar transport system substrate-binding protein
MTSVRSPRRLTVALAIALAIALTASACGSTKSVSATTTASGKPSIPHLTIGYVDLLAAGAYQKRTYDVFKAAANSLGWTINYVDAAGDPAAAETAVQGFVTQRVDAIIDSAVDSSLIRPGLLAAKQAGIPVINVAGQDPPGEAHALLAADYGENEADLFRPVAAKIVSDLPSGSKIAVLKTSLFFAARPRQQVIDEAAAKAGIIVVSDLELPFDVSAATKKISDLLLAHRDIQAVVSVFDVWTVAALTAIKAAGLTNRVKVYSAYADTINLPLMRQDPNIVGLADGTQAAGAAVAVDQLLYFFARKTPIDPHPATAAFTYGLVTRANMPPPGQDGPVSVQGLVAPFLAKWKADFGNTAIGSNG